MSNWVQSYFIGGIVIGGVVTGITISLLSVVLGDELALELRPVVFFICFCIFTAQFKYYLDRETKR